MKRRSLDELLNLIAVKRYVNLCFKNCEENGRPYINEIVSQFGQMQHLDYCFGVDLLVFLEAESEEEESRIFMDIINDELSRNRNREPISRGVSIASVLDQLNDALARPAIVVFYYFADNFCEKEKDILRSIRKYIYMAKEKESEFLGILLVSCDPIDKWELFPESTLDGRHISFFEY